MKNPIAWLRGLAVVVAIGHVALVLVVVALRIHHPFELEWMEGGSLIQVRRILAGQPIYGPPTVEFVPYIYAPLYFYAAALPAAVLGAGFLPLRLTSFVCSLLTGAIIAAWVRRETSSAWAALMALGLYAAAFALTGSWFDIARVDGMFMTLVMGGAYVLRWRDDRWSLAAAGLLMGLACLTKQQGGGFVVLMVAFVVCYRRHAAIAFSLPAVLLPVLTYFLWSHLSQGWSTFYLFDLPKRHYFQKSMLAVFLGSELLVPLWGAGLLIAFHLARRIRQSRDEALVFTLIMTAAMGGVSLLSRLNVGSATNVNLPIYAWSALLFGLAIHHTLEAASRASRRARSLQAGALTLGLVQLCWLGYHPTPWIPTPSDVAAGQSLVKQLAAVPGEVWVPYHPYLAEMAGKRSYAHEMAVDEILIAEPAVRNGFVASVNASLAAHRFDTLLLNSNWPFYGQIKGVWGHYRQTKPVDLPDSAFWPVTGYYTRPAIWLEPKR